MIPMRRFTKLFLLAILHLPPLRTTDPLDGVYPDVLNCFKGIKRVEENWAVELIQHSRDDCKGKHLDKTSVCYKHCLLQGTKMLHSMAYPSEENENRTGYQYCLVTDLVAFKICDLLGIERGSVTVNELLRVEHLVTKCKERSFIVPMPKKMECEDLAPEYKTQLGELISCLEDALKQC